MIIVKYISDKTGKLGLHQNEVTIMKLIDKVKELREVQMNMYGHMLVDDIEQEIEVLETTQQALRDLIEDCEKLIEASRKSGGHENRRTFLRCAVFDAKYGGKSQLRNATKNRILGTWSPKPKDSYIK